MLCCRRSAAGGFVRPLAPTPVPRPSPRLRRGRCKARAPVARTPCLLAPRGERPGFLSLRDVLDCVAGPVPAVGCWPARFSRLRGLRLAGGRPGRAGPGGRGRIRR
ncbi:hypothetical protein XpiCFBP4643_08955 [Xanthomonas pisi]|uniref:Uncharacterized protein n=1 Tax=Xanthomonas pisi TaxID=56457 RepID=A0A2S7D456_9XANT|nr:hypothetical protein XpiCFBP4643_08955 [Xanthomonas pisi]